MFQTKEQGKFLEIDTNEMEISNLPDEEFRVIIINMLMVLWRRMDKYNENFNKEKM